MEAGTEINVWYKCPDLDEEIPFLVNGTLIGHSDEAVEGTYVVLYEEDTITDGMEVEMQIRCIPTEWITELQEA